MNIILTDSLPLILFKRVYRKYDTPFFYTIYLSVLLHRNHLLLSLYNLLEERFKCSVICSRNCFPIRDEITGNNQLRRCGQFILNRETDVFELQRFITGQLNKLLAFRSNYGYLCFIFIYVFIISIVDGRCECIGSKSIQLSHHSRAFFGFLY